MRGRVIGLALAAGIAGEATAADLGATGLPPNPARTWTQCYVGIHGGGLWGNERWTNRTPGGAFFGESLGSHGVSGLIGGGQVGCDYQFSGGTVVGVQGAYAWSDAGGSHPSLHEIGVTYGSEVQSLATVTGRIGHAWQRVLGYVKGGAAWENDRDWGSTIITGLAYQGEPTRFGWTLGVGLEYALTEQISAFIEYNYYDFGSSRIGLSPQLIGLRPAFADLDESRSVVSVGLNFRFGR